MVKSNWIQVKVILSFLFMLILVCCEKKDSLNNDVISSLRGTWYSKPDSSMYSEMYFFGRPRNSVFFQAHDLERRFSPEMIVTYIDSNGMQFKKTQVIDTLTFSLSFLALSRDSILLEENNQSYLFFRLNENIELPQNDFEYEIFENEFYARWKKSPLTDSPPPQLTKPPQ